MHSDGNVDAGTAEDLVAGEALFAVSLGADLLHKVALGVAAARADGRGTLPDALLFVQI